MSVRDAARNRADTTLHSGMYGNGGRTSAGNGHSDVRTNPKSRCARRETPYRVANTTAGQWSTSVSHNTTRLYRNER